MKNVFTIDEVAKFWDSVADTYDQANEKIGLAHYQRFNESLKYLDLKNGDKLLNIWSRSGNAITYLTKGKQIDLYNLEASPKMIALAQKKFPAAKFQMTDLAHLQFTDNFFDGILSLETLEHTPEPEILLKELFRILKPGGKLVMSLPPKTAELPLAIYEKFFPNHGEGPHQFLASKIVKKMLATSGFKLIKHQGTLLMPVGPKFLKLWGEKIIEKMQNTPISELGIRQFYICEKPN